MMQFELPKERPSIIKVIGVGGGGSNAVNHMFRQGIKGVDFLVCNTDHQALEISPVPTKIQLGPSLTEGRGAGAIPEVGKNAAIENIDELRNILRENTKMVFITAGMGGGTGTGAAPIIAGVAREMGILTVAIVTVPFGFEGKKRKMQADLGIEELKKNVDTLLVICNDKLREIHGDLKLSQAFGHADDILAIAAKSIAEIITTTMHINVDFADISTVMRDSGVAIMGSGTAEGENRAMAAVQKALDSPLLNDNEIEGARYILLNITSGNLEVSMDEMGEITEYVQEQAGQTAEVIMGVGTDDTLGNNVNVTIIATGFKTKDQLKTVIVKEEKKVLYDINGGIINDTTSKTENPVSSVNEIVEPTQPQTENIVALNEPTLKIIEPVIAATPIVIPVTIPVQNERIVHSLLDEETPLNNIVETASDIFENEEIVSSSFTSLTEVQEPFFNESLKEVTNNDTFVFEMGSGNIDDFTNEEIPAAVVETPTAPVWMQPIVVSTNIPEATPEPIVNDSPFERAKDRIAKLREMSFKINTPHGLSDLEKEPAYKRKGVQLENVPPSAQNDISRLTLTNDNDNKTEIKSNNSFLHDRVD
jgi:cell division protein FtsZ